MATVKLTDEMVCKPDPPLVCLLLASAALFLVGAFTACDGGGPSDSTDGDISDEVSQAVTEGDPSSDLGALLAIYENADFKVRFDVTENMQGKQVKGTITWYSKRPKVRLDADFTVDGARQKQTFIALEDTSYVCSNESGKDSCSQLNYSEFARMSANQLNDRLHGLRNSVEAKNRTVSRVRSQVIA